MPAALYSNAHGSTVIREENSLDRCRIHDLSGGGLEPDRTSIDRYAQPPGKILLSNDSRSNMASSVLSYICSRSVCFFPRPLCEVDSALRARKRSDAKDLPFRGSDQSQNSQYSSEGKKNHRG